MTTALSTITRAQFRRLAAQFWKTATPEQLEELYSGFRDALKGIPQDAIDAAVTRALQECEEFPKPKHIRDWARDAMPKREPPPRADRLCHFCHATHGTSEHGRVTIEHEASCSASDQPALRMKGPVWGDKPARPEDVAHIREKLKAEFEKFNVPTNLPR